MTEQTVTTMTVYEGLQEIKLLGEKIRKAQTSIAPIIFAEAVKSKDVTTEGDKKEMIAANAKSWMDKYLSWTNRLNLLRGLIYESNLKTPMEVCGKKYTSVAAAITRYKNVQMEIDFYGSLYQEYIRCKKQVMVANARNLDPERLPKVINPSGLEYSVEDLEKMESAYRLKVEEEVFDPLELMKDEKLVKTLDEIREFKEKFHTELNKLNLQTLIQVPIDEPVL